MISFEHGSHRAQRGFTLIEVLVTLVLISVGLLGVAALQLTTLRGNQDSYVRSQASVLAGDILDRMRANPTAFRAGEYDAEFNATGTEGTRAGDDLEQWQTMIDRTLPGGDETAAGGVVLTTGGGRFIATVTIRWRERSTGTGAADDVDVENRTFSIRSEI
jgi:type IV pilus assembly protein PilV